METVSVLGACLDLELLDLDEFRFYSLGSREATMLASPYPSCSCNDGLVREVFIHSWHWLRILAGLGQIIQVVNDSQVRFFDSIPLVSRH